jgi:autotransporter-associated beta strand protein
MNMYPSACHPLIHWLSRFSIVSLVAASLIAPLSAADVFFTGTGTASWSVPANWAGGALPGPDDVAVFTGDSDLTVNLMDVHTVGGIRIANTGMTRIVRGGASGSVDINIGGQGLVIEPGSGPVDLGLDIGNPANQRVKPVLKADQTWVNNSTSLFNKSAGGGAIEIPFVTLTFDGSGDFRIDSAIVDDVVTGSIGSLVKNGSGTLFLPRANPRMFGGFTINQGTVVVGNDQSLAGQDPDGFGRGPVIMNGGTLVSTSNARRVANAFTIAGDFAVGGDFDLTFADNAVALVGDRIITVSGMKSVTVDEATIMQPIVLTIDSVVSGDGLIKAGDAVMVLRAANQYAGPTRVDGGVLVINGDQSAASGALVVAAGATLAGTGTIGGDATVGGVLNPADPVPGLLTVLGSVVMEAGSRAVFEMGLTAVEPFEARASQLKVGGTLNLASGVIVEVRAPDFGGQPGDSLLLVDAAAITGNPTATALELALPAELDGRLRVSGGQLWLDIISQGTGSTDSFWLELADVQGFKDTPTAGWLYDALFPWVYAASMAQWLYVAAEGGSAAAFVAWSPAHDSWLHFDTAYAGWFWNFTTQNWQY